MCDFHFFTFYPVVRRIIILHLTLSSTMADGHGDYPIGFLFAAKR